MLLTREKRLREKLCKIVSFGGYPLDPADTATNSLLVQYLDFSLGL